MLWKCHRRAAVEKRRAAVERVVFPHPFVLVLALVLESVATPRVLRAQGGSLDPEAAPPSRRLSILSERIRTVF
jgi:hypothetical protein